MLRRILGVLTLRARTYREIADDRTATGQAAILVIIMALLSGIGGAVVLGMLANNFPLTPSQTGSPLRFALTTIIYTIIGWLFVSWVFAFVSRIVLHSKSTTLQMARVFGFTQAFAIIAIIPCIGGVVAFILSLIGSIIGIREASRFSTANAIITAVIGYIVYLLIIGAINLIFGAIGLA